MASPGDSSLEETITREATAEEEREKDRLVYSDEVSEEEFVRDDVVAEAAIDLVFDSIVVVLGIVGALSFAAALAFPGMLAEFAILTTASLGMIAAITGIRRVIDTVNDFYGF